jgi:AraC-like DNA-binding protein
LTRQSRTRTNQLAVLRMVLCMAAQGDELNQTADSISWAQKYSGWGGVAGLSWVRFSTSTLPEGLSDSQKALAWAEQHANRKTIGKSEITLDAEHPFLSELVSVDLGPVAATSSRGSPATLRRTTQLVRSNPTDHCVVLLSATDRPFHGDSLGRTFDLPRGAMVLLSYDIANTTHTSAVGTLFSLSMPRSEIAPHVKDPEQLIARTFSGDLAPLRLLRMHVSGIFADQHPMDDTTRALAGRHIRELICAVLQSQTGRPFDDTLDGVRHARRIALERIIAKRFADPDFSLDDAAAALQISRRSVQVLLTQTSETFSDLLTEARLCHARALLKGRLKTGANVADVAGASGFGDLSTFNRRYRAYFGERPTDTKP